MLIFLQIKLQNSKTSKNPTEILGEFHKEERNKEVMNKDAIAFEKFKFATCVMVNDAKSKGNRPLSYYKNHDITDTKQFKKLV